MLELRQPELERVELLARHEPELAGEEVAGLVRHLAELLDAAAQLRAELLERAGAARTCCYLARP